MENVFKHEYMSFAFSRLPLLEPDSNRQVYDLPELWKQLDSLLDHEDFHLMFAEHCDQLDLPHEQFDLENAFHKAQAEWAQHIMLQTADFILRWNEDNPITRPVVFWSNDYIFVDTSVCVKYRDWLLNYNNNNETSMEVDDIDIS